jgi:hypothetical protein
MADECAGEVPRTTFRQPATRLRPVGTRRSSTRATVEPPRFTRAPTTRCRQLPATASTGDNFQRQPFTRTNHLPGHPGFLGMTSRRSPRTSAPRHQHPSRRRAGAAERLRAPTQPETPFHPATTSAHPSEHQSHTGEDPVRNERHCLGTTPWKHALEWPLHPSPLRTTSLPKGCRGPPPSRRGRMAPLARPSQRRALTSPTRISSIRTRTSRINAFNLSVSPSVQRLALSCEAPRERSDRGLRQLKRPSWTAFCACAASEPTLQPASVSARRETLLRLRLCRWRTTTPALYQHLSTQPTQRRQLCPQGQPPPARRPQS